MYRHQRFIERALRLAATSRHHKFKHGCVITRNNRTLAEGINTPRTPARIDWLHASVHAEISALRRVRPGKHDTLYVARVNRYGERMLSRPCAGCWERLAAAGVTEVVYTTPEGFMVEKVR